MLALQVAVRAAISERDLTMRAIAAILPEWLETTYGLTPKAIAGRYSFGTTA